MVDNFTPETLAALDPPPPINRVRWLFMGPDGVRAGWSLLIGFALYRILLFLVQFAVHKARHGRPLPMANPANMSFLLAFVPEAMVLFILLGVTWIISRIERRPMGKYGLGGGFCVGSRAKQFFAGLFWGVTCLSLLVFTLDRMHYLIFDGRALHGVFIFKYACLWGLCFLTVAFLEEYVTRGFVQYTLTRGLAGTYQWLFGQKYSEAFGFFVAAVLFSCLFGGQHGHNPGESPIGLLSAGTVGFVFCLSLWRTGSLWWAIGFHATWDWAESYLYGTADSGLVVQNHLLLTHPVGRPLMSGGFTGPEGSIFVLPVLLLIAIIIFLTLPKRTAPYAP